MNWGKDMFSDSSENNIPWDLFLKVLQTEYCLMVYLKVHFLCLHIQWKQVIKHTLLGSVGCIVFHIVLNQTVFQRPKLKILMYTNGTILSLERNSVFFSFTFNVYSFHAGGVWNAEFWQHLELKSLCMNLLYSVAFVSPYQSTTCQSYSYSRFYYSETEPDGMPVQRTCQN